MATANNKKTAEKRGRKPVQPPPKPKSAGTVSAKGAVSYLYETDPKDLTEQDRASLRNAAGFFIARCKQVQKPTGG